MDTIRTDSQRTFQVLVLSSDGSAGVIVSNCGLTSAPRKFGQKKAPAFPQALVMFLTSKSDSADLSQPSDLTAGAGLAPAATQKPAPEAASRLDILAHDMSPVVSNCATAARETLTLIDMVSKRLTNTRTPRSLDGYSLEQALETHWSADDEALGKVAFHLNEGF